MNFSLSANMLGFCSDSHIFLLQLGLHVFIMDFIHFKYYFNFVN